MTMKTLNDYYTADKDSSINEELSKSYDTIIEKLIEAKNKKLPLNEGLFTSILGGVVGASFGPAVMKAVCEALGINEKGPLGSLITSRLILGAVGAKIGW